MSVQRFTIPSFGSLLRVLPAFALVLGAGVLVSSSATSAAAQEGKQEGARAESADHADEEHSELHKSMEAMQQNLRTLRKLLKKPEDKAKAIELCREMENAALQGFMQMPDAPKELEGTAKLEYEVDFRRRMLQVAGSLLDLEMALEKEDGDEIKALYRALGNMKKEGHNVYIK